MRRPPSAFLTFIVAFVTGTLGVILWTRLASDLPADRHLLAKKVWVSGQIRTDHVAPLAQRDIRLIVALRPDAEEPDQPSSSEIERVAKEWDVDFAYIPVPKEGIPDEAADRLFEVLKGQDGSVLLYCRSGRRAARAWALAEASRQNGLNAEQIRAALTGVDQPINDLEERISMRIKQREANDVSDS